MFTQYDEKGDEYKERRAIRETNNEVKHILYLEVRSRIQKAAHIAELQPNDENTNETVQHGDVNSFFPLGRYMLMRNNVCQCGIGEK